MVMMVVMAFPNITNCSQCSPLFPKDGETTLMWYDICTGGKGRDNIDLVLKDYFLFYIVTTIVLPAPYPFSASSTG
jgi:hypothetical protein